jgi:hypothetical protein
MDDKFVQCEGSLIENMQVPPADGGSKPTPSLQVRPITKREATPVIENYHYSKNVPAGKNLYFGWFVGTLLYAVAIYGIGVNNNGPQFLARTTGLDVTVQNSLELKRLARVEPKIDAAPLTKFLAMCHRMLRKQGYKHVVSYSDPDFNPAGGIYAAANFKMIGWTSAETDILNAEGLKINRRTLLHWRNRQRVLTGTMMTIDEACAVRGFTKVKTQPKKRWFLNIS